MNRRLARGLTAIAVGVGLLLGTSGPVPADPDTTPPLVTLDRGILYQLGTVLTDASADPHYPGTISWTTSDPSGICSQTLTFSHQEPSTGDWQYDQPALNPASRRARISFQVAAPTYEVALAVTDCAGNTADLFTNIYPTLVQQTAGKYKTGWSTSVCPCWSGGSVLRSSKKGASWSSEFYGSIALISDRRPTRGTAKVYIDGLLSATVNLGAPRKNLVTVFQKRYTTGTLLHTLKVVVSKGRFDVDAVVIG
jgi:hypothetical protein